MLKVLSYILCDLDPKVKVIGQKAGICDGVPSTSALVTNLLLFLHFLNVKAQISNTTPGCFTHGNTPLFPFDGAHMNER